MEASIIPCMSAWLTLVLALCVVAVSTALVLAILSARRALERVGAIFSVIEREAAAECLLGVLAQLARIGELDLSQESAASCGSRRASRRGPPRTRP